jgi:hypothetical protein
MVQYEWIRMSHPQNTLAAPSTLDLTDRLETRQQISVLILGIALSVWLGML